MARPAKAQSAAAAAVLAASSAPPSDTSRRDDDSDASTGATAGKKRRKRRKALTADEDVAILRAVLAIRPHHAAHGQGRRRWQDTADHVIQSVGGEMTTTLCKGRFDNLLKRFVHEQEHGGVWPPDAERRDLVMAALEDQKTLERGSNGNKRRMVELAVAAADRAINNGSPVGHNKDKDPPKSAGSTPTTTTTDKMTTTKASEKATATTTTTTTSARSVTASPSRTATPPKASSSPSPAVPRTTGKPAVTPTPLPPTLAATPGSHIRPKPLGTVTMPRAVLAAPSPPARSTTANTNTNTNSSTPPLTVNSRSSSPGLLTTAATASPAPASRMLGSGAALRQLPRALPRAPPATTSPASVTTSSSQAARMAASIAATTTSRPSSAVALTGMGPGPSAATLRTVGRPSTTLSPPAPASASIMSGGSNVRPRQLGTAAMPRTLNAALALAAQEKAKAAATPPKPTTSTAASSPMRASPHPAHLGSRPMSSSTASPRQAATALSMSSLRSVGTSSPAKALAAQAVATATAAQQRMPGGVIKPTHASNVPTPTRLRGGAPPPPAKNVDAPTKTSATGGSVKPLRYDGRIREGAERHREALYLPQSTVKGTNPRSSTGPTASTGTATQSASAPAAIPHTTIVTSTRATAPKSTITAAATTSVNAAGAPSNPSSFQRVVRSPPVNSAASSPSAHLLHVRGPVAAAPANPRAMNHAGPGSAAPPPVSSLVFAGSAAARNELNTTRTSSPNTPGRPTDPPRPTGALSSASTTPSTVSPRTVSPWLSRPAQSSPSVDTPSRSVDPATSAASAASSSSKIVGPPPTTSAAPAASSSSPSEPGPVTESGLLTMLNRLTEMERAWQEDRNRAHDPRDRAPGTGLAFRGSTGASGSVQVRRDEFQELMREVRASRQERAELKQQVASLTAALEASQREPSQVSDQVTVLTAMVEEGQQERTELKHDVASLASLLRDMPSHSGMLQELGNAHQRQAEELRRYQQEDEVRRRVAQIEDRARFAALEQRLDELEETRGNSEPQGEPSLDGLATEATMRERHLSPHDHRARPTKKSRTFNPFAELQATLEKQQALITLYEQAQDVHDGHSRTELELAELRTAIDVERADRTREFEVLLENIQRIVGNSESVAHSIGSNS